MIRKIFSHHRKVSLTICFVLILSAFTLAANMASAEPRIPIDATPQDNFVARVYYDNISDIDQLIDYDVWEYNNLEEKYVLLSGDNITLQQLQNDGWRVEIDEEATAQINPIVASNTFYGGYRRVTELYSDLYTANTNHPTLTEVFKYGDSYCQIQGGCSTLGGELHDGYDLLAIRVSNEAIAGTSTISGTTVISGTKPVFFLMANIHAREITTPEVAMRMLDWLLDNYGTDPDATWIVDWHEIWIIPTANPDGHWLVELGTDFPYNGSPFYQRKNANNESFCNFWPPTSSTHYGIDLNRNHSFAWGGASTNPCSATFQGTGAASESEVAQIELLVSSLIADQRGPGFSDAAPDDTTGLLITMHSYSELILWPWGNTSAPAPNRDALKTIGDKLATYNGYLSCQPSQCLYSVTGATDDWSYGELGIPSFTYELGNQFMPPYGQVDAEQWPDNGPSLQYAAKIVHAPYQEAYGPDALNITAVSNKDDIHIDATINDSQNGGENIAAAMVTFDQPHWVEGTLTYPLEIADGDGNSAIEAVTGIIDVSHLDNGQHMLFVYGQDADGNWGPAGAAFFDVQLSDANVNQSIDASTTYASPSETFHYTISHDIALAGTHTLDLEINNTLPTALIVLSDTITLNGIPMPNLYNSDDHTIVYTSNDQFTDDVNNTITFQVQVEEGVIETMLTSTLDSEGTINGLPLRIGSNAEVAIAAGMSAAENVVTLNVDKTEAATGETIAYQLGQALTYTGNHTYDIHISNPIPAGLTLLPDSVMLNGTPATHLYDDLSNTITYSHTDTFTNAMSLTIDFMAVIDDDVAHDTIITNQFSSIGHVDGYILEAQTSQTAVTQIRNPFMLYLPSLIHN